MVIKSIILWTCYNRSQWEPSDTSMPLNHN